MSQANLTPKPLGLRPQTSGVGVQNMLKIDDKDDELVTLRNLLSRKDEELLEVRVRTLYGMVDTVTVFTTQGNPVRKNVLFLKTKPAHSLSAPDVPKLLAAMGLTKQKLVLRMPRAMTGLALLIGDKYRLVWTAVAKEYAKVAVQVHTQAKLVLLNRVLRLSSPR